MSITVAGKELIADRLTMTTVSAQPLWIAIGTGSPSATALGSEISRKYCKIVSSSGGIITYSCLWDIEDNIEGLVTEIGIFNQATLGGTMLASATTSKNKSKSDSLEITWQIEIL